MKFYLKLLFFYFVFQNVLSDDKLTLTALINSTNVDSPALGLLDSNGTAFNSTSLNTTTTPVLLNCTSNATDLNQCTPINITLSYQCTKVNYDFLIYSTSWQPRLCYSSSDCRTGEQPKWRIQGVRGSFANGTRPAQCCSDKQLKLSELSPIMSELKVCIHFSHNV